MKYLVLFFWIVAGCAQTSVSKNDSLHESNVVISGDLKGSRYSDIYFSGQPSNEDWKKLKDQGFTHVINMRQEKEHDESAEQKMLEDLGITYTHVPMDASQDLRASQVELVTSAVKAHRKKGKTLIHCGSGNRVGYWAGAHFYLDHGYSKEDSLDMAQKMGMTSPRLMTKLKTFMDSEKREEKAP